MERQIDCDAFGAMTMLRGEGATISARKRKHQPGEKLLERTIAFMRDDLFPALDGKNYVESMPVEMAEFITDCWLAVA